MLSIYPVPDFEHLRTIPDMWHYDQQKHMLRQRCSHRRVQGMLLGCVYLPISPYFSKRVHEIHGDTG